MAKLFPPYIEGTIPAFYKNDDGTATITVPFTMNRGVSSSQVKGFAVKIKTVQSSTYLHTETKNISYNLKESNQVRAVFPSSVINKLRLGQYYKLQMAYIDNTDTVGQYSTVGIIKYTSKPKIEIEGMKIGSINSHLHDYVGLYYQNPRTGDVTERVYNYRFDFYDKNHNIIKSSGDQLHNSENDITAYESYDSFSLPQDIDINQTYYIRYCVTTQNGLKLYTPKYRIMKKMSIDPEISAKLNAQLNFDNGYIQLDLEGTLDENNMESPVTGAFLLARSCEDSNYMIWEDLYRFKLAAEFPTRILWKDFTIEQGKHYMYSIQQYNDNGLYSNRMLSNTIYADFEDAFLFDGEKQLKIKYNPKVSSFKTNILESKIDTIGSKYPFIFRNGRVNYKDFPISGLISYQMDEEHLFATKDEILLQETTHNLTGSNIQSERAFKLLVLDWLNNGKNKLFRSPGEGNYIVRLMNISLTPIDQLGRMLHTFNANAYEVEDYTYDSLNQSNFINIDKTETEVMRWETKELCTRNADGTVTFYPKDKKINPSNLQTLRIVDATPGDKFQLIFNNGNTETIEIGVTGSYYIDLGVPIESISAKQDINYASLTYSFYEITTNKFNTVTAVDVSEVPCAQYIGAHDIIAEITKVPMKNGEWKENPKIKLGSFYYLTGSKRTVEEVISIPANADPFILYQIGHYIDDPAHGYGPGLPSRIFVPEYYYDTANDKRIELNDYDPCIYVNGDQVGLEEIQDFELRKPNKIVSLVCGNGAVVTVAYQMGLVDYQMEENNAYMDDEEIGILQRKTAWMNAVNYLDSLLAIDPNDSNACSTLENSNLILENARQDIQVKYLAFIRALILGQEEEEANRV